MYNNGQESKAHGFVVFVYLCDGERVCVCVSSLTHKYQNLSKEPGKQHSDNVHKVLFFTLCGSQVIHCGFRFLILEFGSQRLHEHDSAPLTA